MTADVIADIDAAMDDWEHAGDAFRYSPPRDEHVVMAPRGPVQEAMAYGLDGYLTHILVLPEPRGWVPVFRDGLSDFLPVRDMVDDWERLNYRPRLVPSPAEPTDPRERALAARKTRNTGPPARGLEGRAQ